MDVYLLTSRENLNLSRLRRDDVMRYKHLIPGLLIFILSGCGSESPTTPEAGTLPSIEPALLVPTTESPSSGDEVGRRPTLVAAAATVVGGTVYTFQVSRSADFDGLVTASGQITPDADGRASWKVVIALDAGDHFWRAQAHLSSQSSAFSSAAMMKVNPNITPTPPTRPPRPTPPTVDLFDPLTDGTSIGQVGGGQFTSDGWRVKNKADFLRYEISSIPEGFVEWENLGLTPQNKAGDQFMLLGMWDPTKGRYRTNPYRVHVQKLDTNHNAPFVRLRWIANGDENDGGFNFLNWNPDRVYQWRLEWGPEGEAHVVRLFLNGQSIIRVNYERAYDPSTLYVELGIEERQESVVGAVYRNVRIGPR